RPAGGAAQPQEDRDALAVVLEAEHPLGFDEVDGVAGATAVAGQLAPVEGEPVAVAVVRQGRAGSVARHVLGQQPGGGRRGWRLGDGGARLEGRLAPSAHLVDLLGDGHAGPEPHHQPQDEVRHRLPSLQGPWPATRASATSPWWAPRPPASRPWRWRWRGRGPT